MSTRSARVTEDDKRRMACLAADLREAEVDTVPAEDVRERVIAWANRGRVAAGLPELREEYDHIPEAGIYERARALGMRRIDR